MFNSMWSHGQSVPPAVARDTRAEGAGFRAQKRSRRLFTGALDIHVVESGRFFCANGPLTSKWAHTTCKRVGQRNTERTARSLRSETGTQWKHPIDTVSDHFVSGQTLRAA
jgi:hypothetical protein